MQISFDGRTLLNPHTGIQTHLVSLVKELSLMSDDDTISVFMGSSLSVPKAKRAGVADLALPNVVYKPFGRTIVDVFRQSGDSYLKNHTDVYHETGIWKIPTDKPSILTVHDVLPCLFPEMFPSGMYEIFTDVVGYNVQRASIVVADSQATKESFEFFFGRHNLQARVVYPGVDKSYNPVTDKDADENIRKKYGIPDNYLLFLGTIEPRKNVQRILEAFAIASPEAPDMKLVVSGGYGWHAGHIYLRYKELDLSDRVVFTGYIDELDKPSIYRGATAFLFPSIYEGFGFPALEAMACGVPVISSSSSSLKEVVGDAGILVDPLDTGQLAGAISRVLGDTALRKDMATKGLKQAGRFTWRKTADQYLKISHQLGA